MSNVNNRTASLQQAFSFDANQNPTRLNIPASVPVDNTQVPAAGTLYIDSDGAGRIRLFQEAATVPFSAAITAVWDSTSTSTIRFDAAASRVAVTLTATGTVTGTNEVIPSPNPFGQNFYFNSPGTAQSATPATPQNISFSGSITGTDSKGGSSGSPHAVFTSVSVYYPAFAGISATIPTTWANANALGPEYTDNPTTVNVAGPEGDYFVLVTRGVVSRIITALGDVTFSTNTPISIAGQTYRVVSVPNYGGGTQSFTITYSSQLGASGTGSSTTT